MYTVHEDRQGVGMLMTWQMNSTPLSWPALHHISCLQHWHWNLYMGLAVRLFTFHVSGNHNIPGTAPSLNLAFAQTGSQDMGSERMQSIAPQLDMATCPLKQLLPARHTRQGKEPIPCHQHTPDRATGSFRSRPSIQNPERIENSPINTDP